MQDCIYCLCEDCVNKTRPLAVPPSKGLAIYDIPEKCIEFVVVNSCGPRQLSGVHDPVAEVSSSRGVITSPGRT
jgi:hypothetical protein